MIVEYFLPELYNDKTVSVLLDGEETTMEFLDFNDGEVSCAIIDIHLCSFLLYLL